MRLVGAHKVRLAHHLQVAWVRQGPVPPDGKVLWSVFFATPTDRPRQLGQLIDGQFSAQFIFDFGTGQQHDMDDDVAVAGDALVARYPLSAVDGWGSMDVAGDPDHRRARRRGGLPAPADI